MRTQKKPQPFWRAILKRTNFLLKTVTDISFHGPALGSRAQWTSSNEEIKTIADRTSSGFGIQGHEDRLNLGQMLKSIKI